jgi:hypothetical protein
VSTKHSKEYATHLQNQSIELADLVPDYKDEEEPSHYVGFRRNTAPFQVSGQFNMQANTPQSAVNYVTAGQTKLSTFKQ